MEEDEHRPCVETIMIPKAAAQQATSPTNILHIAADARCRRSSTHEMEYARCRLSGSVEVSRLEVALVEEFRPKDVLVPT